MDENIRLLERQDPLSKRCIIAKYRAGMPLTNFQLTKILEHLTSQHVKELFWSICDAHNGPVRATWQFYVAEIGSVYQIVFDEAKHRKLNLLRLEDLATFAWSFHYRFFLETTLAGNYVWNDPDYDGDNVITPFAGSSKDFCRNINVPFLREKGTNTVGQYCGPSVILKDGNYTHPPKPPPYRSHIII